MEIKLMMVDVGVIELLRSLTGIKNRGSFGVVTSYGWPCVCRSLWPGKPVGLRRLVASRRSGIGKLLVRGRLDERVGLEWAIMVIVLMKMLYWNAIFNYDQYLRFLLGPASHHSLNGGWMATHIYIVVKVVFTSNLSEDAK